MSFKVEVGECGQGEGESDGCMEGGDTSNVLCLNEYAKEHMFIVGGTLQANMTRKAQRLNAKV